MKVLHTSIMSEPPLGVFRQLEAEQESANNLGLDWQAVLYTDSPGDSPIAVKSSVSAVGRIKFRIAYYRWLLRKSKEFDVILLRYSFHDPFQLMYIIACTRPIYTVHHTLEGPELSLVKSKATPIKLVIEKVLGAISLSLVNGIVAGLFEVRDYELDRRLIKRNIPSTIYTNGIDFYDNIDFEAPVPAKEGNPPTLLFISSEFAPWQGLEELVAAAKIYDGEFICHVVGDLSPEQAELVDADSRFVKYGRQNRAFITEKIAESDIGLSALALYKKNLKNVPALKVREYLKEGLAVYAGHGDVLPDDYPYFKDGPIDLAEMVEFALEHRDNNRQAVSESARPYIEKAIILRELYEFLETHEKPQA